MEHDERIGKMGYIIVEPGIRWHLSVSPTLVLARSSNAAAQLPLRGQSEREALRSYPTGQVRRKEKGCPYISHVNVA